MDYDIILRNGTIYDGSGSAPYRGDVAIKGDQIAAVGDIGAAAAPTERDVTGLAVAPGFINMLSWAPEALIADGRSQSDIRQGVTLEVMGEGVSFGPLNERMKKEWGGGILGNDRIDYEIEWTTLGEFLHYLENRGVSTNVTSFVGTGTLRVHAVGYDDRPPTPAELQQMQDLTRQAMQEGAVGLSAALIYPPASYAKTDEIMALARVVAEHDGLYISHLRSEGSFFLEALDELIHIARETGVRAEVYHLKAAGENHWPKMDAAIEKIEAARAEGLSITADMYTYNASGTGLDACIPPWAHDGGDAALLARLHDPETRQRIKQDMNTPSTEWENMWLETVGVDHSGADRILLAGLKAPELHDLRGKRLAEVAELWGMPPDDTLIDLLIKNQGRVFTIYFSMSEDNLRKQVALPWVSFCSDAESLAPEGVFLKSNPHPRAYGSFARVIGHYCRDEGLMPLADAVRRLSAFPAEVLKIERRGRLQAGYYADVVVFDPAAVRDHTTFEQPHQYATGMQHVFVNGVAVLRDGEHTGATPGRFVKAWRT